MTIVPKCPPPLDPEFVPAALWNRSFREAVEASQSEGDRFGIALEQPGGIVSVYETALLPDESTESKQLNFRYVERLVKFLLWQRGGFRIYLGGNTALSNQIAELYQPGGALGFDADFMGKKAYRETFEIVVMETIDELPAANEAVMSLGGHLDGCRIGFDLGGSDRKCAAVIDGEVVFSEEVEWDPYFQSDPQYHLDGIQHSLERAAEHLPRIDAIGGSAAGIYVNNEARVGSLFRGVPDDVFEKRVRRLFFEVQEKWGGVPFEIVNDGEVTALAGAIASGDTGVLGVAMGTSEAVGYVTPGGNITTWLNELAFAPLDYRMDAPADEWSGGVGVGAQYLCQQAVARLATPERGFNFAAEMGFPDRLKEVQKRTEVGDKVSEQIFESIGRYFGYAVAHYADFYEIHQVLALGRVTSGAGGDILLKEAKQVLKIEFPELAESIRFRTPGEKEKRHGQAVAAASLPAIK